MMYGKMRDAGVEWAEHMYYVCVGRTCGDGGDAFRAHDVGRTWVRVGLWILDRILGEHAYGVWKKEAGRSRTGTCVDGVVEERWGAGVTNSEGDVFANSMCTWRRGSDQGRQD